MKTASIIIADENEGRRNLLANTFAREGFEVTRLSTLGQAEATAVAVRPDVLLMEGEWSQGSVLDSCQSMSSQPNFRSATRVVVLSRTTAPDFLASAAMAGIAEVIGKPVDMNQLVAQIQRHASKQFVPPPADVSAPASGGFSGQRFDVGMTMNDSQWALPMLRRLVESGNVDDDFVASILGEMPVSEGEGEGLASLSSSTMAEMLRLALNRLVGTAPGDDTNVPSGNASGGDGSSSAPSFKNLNKGATLGEGATSSLSGGMKSSMEDILERQAEDIANQVEREMDGILSEEPDYVSLLERKDQIPVDPETLTLTRLSTQLFLELMEALQRPGALSDLTLLTQVEDANRMAIDVLEALPASEEEE